MFTSSADTLHCTYMHVRVCIHTFTGIPTHPHIQDGLTALHIAAACGHEDVLELLLEANMDPDIKDEVIMQHVR